MAAYTSDGAETRGRKRARKEVALCEFPHHQELWLEDGNVIIITSKSMAFRVHKSVLSKHSTVFKTTFLLPQPADEERMEGCSVVHVDDKPEVFENFLNVLYQCLRFVSNCAPSCISLLY